MQISVLALVVAVKAVPMPFPMKEALLDQLLGHHDDLHRRTDSPDVGRPLYERTVRASRIGAFGDPYALNDGSTVYAYFKNDVHTYDLTVRDGCPVHCTCVDFRIKTYRHPSYTCKHGDLWLVMKAGLERLIEASGDAAKAYMIARQRLRTGEGSAAEVTSAYQTLREIEARIGCFLPGEEIDPEADGHARRFETASPRREGEERLAVAA